MQKHHFDLWKRCRAFVGDVCRGRDASHGLSHMEKVTEQALLIYSLRERRPPCGPTVESCVARTWQANADLYRIILVGMLHDVADHKYDHDGTLDAKVAVFVEAEAGRLVALAERCHDLHEAKATGDATAFFSPPEAAQVVSGGVARLQAWIGTAFKAISYSAEKKRGMRWFEQELPADWCHVRDCVSDADKLEAIGEAGLWRCYEFAISRVKEAHASNHGGSGERVPGEPRSSSDGRPSPLESRLLQDVSDHYEEKLSQLLPTFIVTDAGKFLGTPRHEDMAALLAEWRAHGPPPVTTFWRDAPDSVPGG